MKKIIALVCAFCLLFTLVLPLTTPMEASAERYPWSQWSLGSGATIENGMLKIRADRSNLNAEREARLYLDVPAQFTVSFTAKIDEKIIGGSHTGTFFGAYNGSYCAGFNWWSDYIRAYGNLEILASTSQTEWHTYTLEVDGNANKQTLYIDGVRMNTHPICGSGSAGFVRFVGVSTDLTVSDFSYKSGISGGGERLKLTQDYTEPFFQDWYEIDGWMVEDSRFVEHDKENGIIKLKTGGMEHSAYRSIERPLRATTNYDMEWRLRRNDVYAENMFGFELSEGNRHTEWNINPRKMSLRDQNNGGLIEDEFVTLVPYSLDDDWHVFKAEMRGTQVTWFIDDKEVMSHQVIVRPNVANHIAFYHQNEIADHAETWIDWVKYTPYFEEELSMVQPMSGSVFAEGADVQIQAKTATDVEKIDYYINGVYIGSGYKKDNYIYTLKDARVGSYNVSAKIENIETVENSFSVKKVMDAELSLNKSEVNYGDKVTATVAVDSVEGTGKAVKVEYYVDGNKVASSTKAPYTAVLPVMEVGTANVYAKVWAESGVSVQTTPKKVVVNYVQGKKLEMSREYELNYTYKSGTGKVEINDGYFKLGLTNEGNKVKIETLEGGETYEGIGAGEYKVIVTAGYAELYYNNHFAKSFFMPTSTDAQSIKTSGVSNVALGGSGVKSTIYKKDWNKKANFLEDDLLEEQYYYSVEFDKTDSSAETFEYYDGMFGHIISFREDGIYANRQQSMSAPATELKLADTVKPGYYRITTNFGVSQLFCNNEIVGSYRAEKMPSNTLIKRTMSNPSASTFVAVKNTDDIFYHTSTFENITEFADEEYWRYFYTIPAKKATDKIDVERVEDKNGNHYISLKGSGKYLLDGIAQNPVLKWRGMVNSTNGTVSVTYGNSYGNIMSRIGYDFASGEWFFDEMTGMAVTEFSNRKVKSDPGALVAKKWYDFELVVNKRNAKLFCDGKEVFNVTQDNTARGMWFGRVGFCLEGGASMAFDDFEYQGENKVSAGMYLRRAGDDGETGHPSAFFKDAEGKVYSSRAAAYTSTVTDDRGLTWTAINDLGQSANIVQKPDGTLVRQTVDIYGNAGNTRYAQVSYDYGVTWSEQYQINKEPLITPSIMESRMTCTMDGRVFIVYDQGSENWGDHRIFYSDDGMTWFESETKVSTAVTGNLTSECTVIDAPNGDLWLLMRSDSGFIDYLVSKDGGKTFDTTPHHTSLMSPASMFNIRRDWDNPNVYYTAFVYDMETIGESYIAFSRSQCAFAVSYDGMKTWEYIAAIYEADESTGHMTSDIHVSIFDNTLYYKGTFMGAGAGAGGAWNGSYHLEKAKTLKRMPQIHSKRHIGTDARKDIAKDHTILPKGNGVGFVLGEFMDVKVNDGMAEVDIMARAFSVNSTKTSSGVEFRMGDSVVKFNNNSASYTVNGESFTADKTVLKNGYLDIKTLCDIYGKVYRETENSYGIIDNAVATDFYQAKIDAMAYTK